MKSTKFLKISIFLFLVIFFIILFIFTIVESVYSEENIFYRDPNLKVIISENGFGYIDEVKEMSFLYSKFELNLIKSIEERNNFINYNNVRSQLILLSWWRE